MSPPNEGVGIIVGILLTVVMHCLVLTALILASSYLPFFKRDYNVFLIPISIGLWQIIYVIPLIFLLKKRQRWGVMKGVLACAVLTALLNGGCWVFLVFPK